MRRGWHRRSHPSQGREGWGTRPDGSPPPPAKGPKVFEVDSLGLYFRVDCGTGGWWSCSCSPCAGENFCQVGGTRSWEGARVILALLIFQLLVGCAPPRSSRVVIGAKNFTEQVVLGELLAQEIEAVTGERVERRFYLAGSYICQQALVSGRIDGYVEYTGTALTAILKQPLPPVGQRDAATVLRRVTDLYQTRYGVRVGPPLGFEDTFAMVVRGDDARRMGLKTISDAVRLLARDGAPEWRLGVGYEFQSRPDGLVGLEATYGLKFKENPRTMDLGLLYRALS
ncbi:MAG: Substrate-binding region of ABC-type glycine betaine transport system, partial [Edaphobacter sp.]|nr:Substrate-binding region of ABC-type glycine betaine transport system [Edaphobacter sp.]